MRKIIERTWWRNLCAQPSVQACFALDILRSTDHRRACRVADSRGPCFIYSQHLAASGLPIPSPPKNSTNADLKDSTFKFSRRAVLTRHLGFSGRHTPKSRSGLLLPYFEGFGAFKRRIVRTTLLICRAISTRAMAGTPQSIEPGTPPVEHETQSKVERSSPPTFRLAHDKECPSADQAIGGLLPQAIAGIHRRNNPHHFGDARGLLGGI